MEGHFAFFVNGLNLINLIFWSKLQVLVAAIEHHSPAGNYIFKVNNRNTRTWPHSGVFTVKFGHITHLVLVFEQVNTGWERNAFLKDFFLYCISLFWEKPCLFVVNASSESLLRKSEF